MSESSSRYLGFAVSFGLGVACALPLARLAGPSHDAGPAVTATSAVTGQAAAGSMEGATATLAARLAAGQGSDADWDLLAQSYEFLGRKADAERARQHQVPAGDSLEDAVAVSAGLLGVRATTMPARAATAQGDVTSLLAQAEEQRRRREFQGAAGTYAIIAQRGAMTADSWADYADAQAALAGSLAGEPARSIEAALALDPNHAKALWLKASLAHEQRRYGEAIATWKKLLAIVPAGSSDARIVETNLAEATRLARG